MSKDLRIRNGGQIVIEHLRNYGVRRIFMVAGESYLPCIDALYDHQGEIQAVACRQEGGAAYMAEAHGKLTGTPGICFVTRGPGATNASIGVHTAYQDSTPMILFVGQVDAGTQDRDAFQEIDYRRMFSCMSKWVAQVDSTERLPEYLARAFAVATQGRPGPVVLVLPEQVLWGSATVADVMPFKKAHPSPMPSELAQMQSLLQQSERPFLLLGGNGWTPATRQIIESFASRYQIPVGVGWRRQECFDNRHPNYAGHVGYGLTAELEQRIKEADLIIALGSRLNQPTTVDYTLLVSPQPTQQLIHIYPDADELGRTYRPTLAIQADIHGFAEAVQNLQPISAPARGQHVVQANQQYLDSLVPLDMPGPMNLNTAASIVAKRLPIDSCVTAGAGNFALFPHRYIQISAPGTQLSPILGAMGYGLPAAIAAKLEQPEKVVVCYAGDGCFQMTMQELGTAAQQKLGMVVLVFNNSTWGTIRMHQEREFPGRVIGLGLSNPDFAAIARAYGGHGETVTRTEDFASAFERSLAFAASHHLPALIEIQYDVEGISPETTLSQIREAAFALRKEN